MSETPEPFVTQADAPNSLERHPASTSTGGQVALGFFGALGADLLFWVAAANDSSLVAMVLFIGLTQWLWLVPAAIYASAKGRRGIKNGILIAGALVFLLNATFWGVCFYGLSKI